MPMVKLWAVPGAQAPEKKHGRGGTGAVKEAVNYPTLLLLLTSCFLVQHH